MSEDRKYWKVLDEFEPLDEERDDQLKTMVSTSTSRRSFLKVLGLGTASAALIASCKRPVEKAIPYFIKPEEITPGIASYYASGYYRENEFASVLVKVRDGRPIKLEPNPKSVINPQGTSGKVQASVMDVYNAHGYKKPTKSRDAINWETADAEIVEQLKNISASGKEIVLLTPTIISPSTKKLIEEFSETFHAKWIPYDAMPMDAFREANQTVFGTNAIPEYHFDKADVVVSIACDFLGTWLSPIEFAAQYATRRDLTNGEQDMNRLYQIEAGMSLTGSNADIRIRTERSEFGAVLATIYNHFAAKSGMPTMESKPPSIDLTEVLADLEKSKGKSLVVCGDNHPDHQILVNAINYMLGNVGNTVSFKNTYNSYQGDEKGIQSLMAGLESKSIGAVVVWDANPVYNHPLGEKLKSLLSNAELTVALGNIPDETSELCTYVLPSPGFVECWDDAEFKSGIYTVLQPTLSHLFDSRQAQQTLLAWLGKAGLWRDYIKEYWTKELFKKQNKDTDPERFWINSLRNGEFVTQTSELLTSFSGESVMGSLLAVSQSKPADGLAIELYENVTIGSGAGPLNPWTQECPDPVTRMAWGNCASIAPALGRKLKLKNGDQIKIGEIKLPVIIQVGQADNTVSIPVGYGRTAGVPDELVTGVSTWPLMQLVGGYRTTVLYGQQLQPVHKNEKLAVVQTHASMEGRAIIREAKLEEWKHDQSAGNEMHKEVEKHNATLYDQHEYQGHHWAMVIDLNKCIGCNTCVLACNTENNVPVVGKQEVIRVHEMHWIRVDRYYNGDENNPETVRQPVMCQHCDNAPCENVCPVAATNHSSEGLNQMAYNRCIGTRYCNNNCPYKVRRFNWLDYTGADAIPLNRHDPTGVSEALSRMRHNPDVVVRAKGVIEKCSFCVQRIQEKKLAAKLEGRQLKDGDIKPACQQSCPTNAIVFGDVNNPNSEVSRLMKDPRNYHLLEEIHTLPSVGYLTKIRNKS